MNRSQACHLEISGVKSEASQKNQPPEHVSALAPSNPSGQFSGLDPEGTAAFREQEYHRRLWLRHALQTPQPARLNRSPE
jgi:hypothetical protein